MGEPTDLRVYRGQRGRMEFEIDTTGQSAHGAHNQKGVNAIYKMMPLISELETFDLELPNIKPLGKGSLTVSQITSKAPSLCSVPDNCLIHIDRRLTAGETMESANKELQKINAHVVDQNIELTELNSTKDKFFSIIGHDLKGPLNSLTSFSQLLINHTASLTEDEIREIARDLDESLKNLFEFFQDYLQFLQ